MVQQILKYLKMKNLLLQNWPYIEAGDFVGGKSWNNQNTWAIENNSVREAGCIHTAQGLEFDYVGVIIGDDLRYENG